MNATLPLKSNQKTCIKNTIAGYTIYVAQLNLQK